MKLSFLIFMIVFVIQIYAFDDNKLLNEPIVKINGPPTYSKARIEKNDSRPRIQRPESEVKKIFDSTSSIDKPERDLKHKGSEDRIRKNSKFFGRFQTRLSRLDDDDDHEIVIRSRKNSNDVKTIFVKCDNKSSKRSKKCKSSCSKSHSHGSKGRRNDYWRRGLNKYHGHDIGSLIHEYAICPHVHCTGNKVALNPPSCFCGCGNYEEMRACFAHNFDYTWDSEKCQCERRQPHEFILKKYFDAFWNKFYPRIVE